MLNITSHEKQFLKILWGEVWKGGFQLIQILGLLGMYFDAVVDGSRSQDFFSFIQIGSDHTVIVLVIFDLQGLWRLPEAKNTSDKTKM